MFRLFRPLLVLPEEEADPDAETTPPTAPEGV